MSELMKLIAVAESEKPKMGEPCNHCGWCCLTEVCDMGRELTGSSMIPCSLLVERDGGHYCSVANTEAAKDSMGFGTGCCAETQTEVLARMLAQ